MAFEAAATSSFDKQIQEVAMFNYALLIHETAFTGFGESVTIFEDFLNDFPNSQYARQSKRLPGGSLPDNQKLPGRSQLYQ